MPVEPSPDRWTSHPATIGHGIASASGVAILLVLGALLGRLILRWRNRRR